MECKSCKGRGVAFGRNCVKCSGSGKTADLTPAPKEQEPIADLGKCQFCEGPAQTLVPGVINALNVPHCKEHYESAFSENVKGECYACLSTATIFTRTKRGNVFHCAEHVPTANDELDQLRIEIQLQERNEDKFGSVVNHALVMRAKELRDEETKRLREAKKAEAEALKITMHASAPKSLTIASEVLEPVQAPVSALTPLELAIDAWNQAKKARDEAEEAFRRSIIDCNAILASAGPREPTRGFLIGTSFEAVNGSLVPIPMYHFASMATEQTPPVVRKVSAFDFALPAQAPKAQQEPKKERKARSAATPAATPAQGEAPKAKATDDKQLEMGASEALPGDFPIGMVSFQRYYGKSGRGFAWYVKIGEKSLRYNEYVKIARDIGIDDPARTLKVADWIKIANQGNLS